MPGAPDDLVAVAEAGAGLQGAVLVPERREALLELVELGCERGVVALRKEMPELGAALGRAVDLRLI